MPLECKVLPTRWLTMDDMVRAAGLVLSLAYGTFVMWLYAAQPQNVREVTGGLAASVGVYAVDPQAMQDGLAFFRNDQFEEARAAFARADPARRDASTQFYIAYSYYRQGWGRFYNDDQLFAKGLEAVDRAITLAPSHRLVIEDANLGMRTGDELRAELLRGRTRELSDFNPLRILGPRK
jgi:tetratricopeptide (TPR) repeat protein